jgi:autotransporter-associated beta strand protein
LPARDVKKKVKAVLKQRYFYYLSPQMKQPIKEIMNIKPTAMIKLAMLLATSMAFHVTSQAQLATATWTGGGGDGEWNTALNWDQGLPPGDGTNAVVGAGNTVNYNLPMAAGDFGNLALNGVLNVNASGFILGSNGVAVTVSGSAAKLFVNNGGALNATNGGLTFTAASGGTLSVGASIALKGTLNLGTSGTGNTGFMTNNGGTLSVNALTVNPNNNASSSLCLINGGTNNLGNVSILRSTSGSSAFSTFGTEGFFINGGLVNINNLNVGNATANSSLTMAVAGGIVTNTGTFTVTLANNRSVRFLQTGGLFVSTGAGAVLVGNTNAGQLDTFSVTGGTNLAPGFILGNITNNSGTVSFTNGAAIYVGGLGMVSTQVQTLNVVLNSGGRFGASADWTATVPMLMNGGAFDAEDLAGTAHNITLNGRLSGAGGLNKLGPGTLTLNGTNTYTGNTVVGQGTLVIGATGSYANSTQISVGSGTVLDVSASSSSSTNLLGTQTLGGKGAVVGSMNALAGAKIQPGGNTTAGTLIFSNALSETGSVLNNFDLSDDPTGIVKTNDFLYVAGDLGLSGVNTIQVNALNGTLPPGGIYTLIQYSGNLIGGVANLSLAGASGSLSNDATAKTISLVIQSGNRAPTNIVWVGNATINSWDNTNGSTNWLNGTSLDHFVTGDSVRFDATGAANPVVTLSGSLNPANTIVDSASAYTFSGLGTLDGTGGLTKTNTGTLTVLTVNSYPGSTIIGGGILEAINLANSGVASSIGASGGDPTNLVLFDTTLRYIGANASSDHGATLNGVTDTIEVTNGATTLTMSGVLTGPAALVKAGRGVLTLSGNNSPASGTIISNGVLQLNAAGTGGTVGITNRGATLRLGSAFILLNVVDFEGNCTVDLNNAGGDSELNGAWSGSGNVTVINQQGSTARTLTVGGNGNGGGNLANFYGTLSMGTNIGFLRFNDGGGSPNLGSTNVAIDLGTGSATFLIRNGGVTVNFGSFAGGPNTKLSGRGSGTAATATYSVGGLNTSTLFAGSIVNGGNPTAITKVGTGVWTLSGTNTYTGATIISNGVLALSGFGSVSNTPTISVLTNTFLDVSARTDGTLTLNTNQTLQGSGTIHGSVTAPASSTLTVGDDANLPEAMVITNSLTLQSGCTLNMDLDHYQFAGALTNDVIQGLASVTYGGTLNLSVTSIETNSVFKLFSAGSYNGAFESISPALPPLFPAVWAWDTSRLTVDGTLRITNLRPSISSISISGTDLTISGLNGIPGSDFYLLTSTNVALPLSQWTSIATNNFGGGGNFQFTFSAVVDPAATQQFYLLQIP